MGLPEGRLRVNIHRYSIGQGRWKFGHPSIWGNSHYALVRAYAPGTIKVRVGQRGRGGSDTRLGRQRRQLGCAAYALSDSESRHRLLNGLPYEIKEFQILASLRGTTQSPSTKRKREEKGGNSACGHTDLARATVKSAMPLISWLFRFKALVS